MAANRLEDLLPHALFTQAGAEADLTAFLTGKTIIANDNANFAFPRHKRSINQAAVRPAF
jgi:hypothetical protein